MSGLAGARVALAHHGGSDEEIRRLLAKIAQQQPPGLEHAWSAVAMAPKTSVPGPHLPLPATRLRTHINAA